MSSHIYAFLSGFGYNHPLHPAFTHLPVGLTIGSFIFIAIAYFLRRPLYFQSAKHCIVLALLATIPTAIAGYFDWQYFYAGSLLFPVKMKLGLALALVLLLFVVVFESTRRKKVTFFLLLLHLLCLLLVIGIGYFGGELVFGKKLTVIQTTDKTVTDTKSVIAGANYFEKKCSFCHVTDSTDTKVGPGLKGLFDREKMPVSGWPVSAEGLRRQLKSPYNQMPSFENLTKEEIESLTSYLRSL